MKFNAILNIKDVTEESPGDEPVSLQEAKDYMRLEGFTDENESTSDDLSDFDFDDDLITSLIITSRELLERKTGSHFIPKTLEVHFTNLRGRIELPGPVGEVSELLDVNGNEITTYELVGNVWKFLKSPCKEDMTITYEAGYGGDETVPLPEGLKIAMLRLVSFLYQNREDTGDVLASKLARPYSRRTWF